MTNGNVKPANSKWNKTKSDYQLIFDKVEAIIQPVEDNGDIKMNSFTYNKIDEIMNMNVNSTVDIAAYVMNPGSSEAIQLKNGSRKERRVVQLYDDSNVCMELTLWGEPANNFTA
mmetsp:Transcript_8757/g.7723  ORF Transcript_8757/g.7723 Transcript_8757/m.7723 type:complete len:115 (+) Transcript_8757:484-828(+)